MIQHHPDESLLLEYSAGNLNTAQALCLRLHLDVCSRCRCQVDMLDSVGAMLLQEEHSSALSDDLFDRILTRIDTLPEDQPNAKVPTDPLKKLVGELNALPWKRQLVNVSVYDLSEQFPDQPGQVVLQKISAGGKAPVHTHRGTETTVVVQGGFTDNRGVFEAGDFVVLGQQDVHKPIALHGEDCITLSILSAPVKLTGPLGRLLNPFIR